MFSIEQPNVWTAANLIAAVRKSSLVSFVADLSDMLVAVDLGLPEPH